jgi:hypothetical protein
VRRPLGGAAQCLDDPLLTDQLDEHRPILEMGRDGGPDPVGDLGG